MGTIVMDTSFGEGGGGHEQRSSQSFVNSGGRGGAADGVGASVSDAYFSSH